MQSEMVTNVVPDGGIVQFVLSKIWYRPEQYADLFQAGYEALLKARQVHDESRSAFSTFAFRCIMGAVLDARRGYTTEKSFNTWASRYNQGARVRLLSVNLWDLRVTEVIRDLFVEQSTRENEERDERISNEQQAKRLLESLTEDERSLVIDLFWNDMDFRQAAEKRGTSRQAQHQRWKRILEKLQKRARQEAA